MKRIRWNGSPVQLGAMMVGGYTQPPEGYVLQHHAGEGMRRIFLLHETFDER